MRFKKVFLGLLILALFLLPQLAFAVEASTWSQVAAQTFRFLINASQSYQKGQVEEAIDQVNQAYFGPFESQGMEAAIRLSISSDRAFEFEDKFREIKRLMNSQAPAAQVQKAVEDLGVMLRQDAAVMDGTSESPFSAFLNSFIIIVREGVEAILVLGALIAYMIKSGNQNKVRTIYQSALLAILASILTAIGLKFLFNISGASQEILEGITMLLAVAVLFTVSFWLLSKAQAKKWQEYIDGKIQTALTTGSSFALASAAFLAVYREGAETVLFYQALISGNPAAVGMISIGFIIGTIVLALIYILIRYGSVRIPLKQFFTVTGILLYYLAFVFSGKGINELQAGGLIGSTPIQGGPLIGFLGIYPTWESLGIQIFLILAFFGGLTYQFLSSRQANSLKESPIKQKSGI